MTAIVSIFTVMKEHKTFSLSELAALVDLPERTIRYYIQSGLVPKPLGVGRGAHYDITHAGQLLQIRKWSDAGLSLERIGQLLGGSTDEELPPLKGRRAGDIEVWSRLFVADGIEISLEPSRAGLSPEQVREFSRKVMSLYREVTEQDKRKEKN
jgi:DNA-binding transcriptional MerR regulator